MTVTRCKEPTCIGCGCTDSQACFGGCFWRRLSERLNRGVCSNCETHVARFDDDDFEIREADEEAES